MTPEEATAKQIEIYRGMTGEQRLKIALELHELACNLARAGIRRQFPGAGEEEVEERLRARIRMAQGYE